MHIDMGPARDINDQGTGRLTDYKAGRGLRALVRSWFPDREFFVRSQGQVRFITLSSRVQMAAAALIAMLVVAWAALTVMAGLTHYRASSEFAALEAREARVASSEQRLSTFGDDLEAVTSDLQHRQEFIEAMIAALPAEADAESGAPAAGEGDAGEKAIDKLGAAFPAAAPLLRIEARQLAVVARLTRYADSRSQTAAAALRTLGLDPDAMVRRADRSAMGGPLERLATAADGSVDPRFERLELSIARMAALEDGLTQVPHLEPASLEYISSGFGYRRDPFTGAAAMHKGLDFRGPTGAPIYAAAAGRISFVGQKSGYGLTVEITHGNGLMTRYAHMSRFAARAGEQVSAGDVIGAIGSTGRSTGPHLHFEVRLHDVAVNPRKFLETAPNVLEEIRRAPRLALTR